MYIIWLYAYEYFLESDVFIAKVHFRITLILIKDVGCLLRYFLTWKAASFYQICVNYISLPNFCLSLFMETKPN